jgi:DNA-binding response OmpR family regulator/anti-sigma regulatory factor (Ser/Thr protein kinase)
MVLMNKFKILIAEDAPVQGKKLQYVLEKFGYEVFWALDGDLAFEKLSEHNFSLVISDYQMPNLDGLEFLKKVRHDPRFQNIPFILLTTIEDEMVFLESLEAGANEFLNKPFRPEELKLRTKNLISLYHFQQVLNEDNRDLNLKVYEQNKLLKKHLVELNEAHEELKKIQEQAIINSKMISLGIIKMHNKKLRQFLDKDEFDRERMIKLNDQIDKSTERINAIVTHLKQFSKTENAQSHEVEIVSIEETLVNLKDFYGGLIDKYEIVITTDVDPSLRIKISPSSFEQVLINLIHNAVDAVDKTVNRKIQIRAFLEEENACVEIEDNGHGIPKEIQSKIFDPFFTTKETGSGSGLGLSLVNSYLKNFNGKIHLTSVPGKTIFKITFRNENECKERHVA